MKISPFLTLSVFAVVFTSLFSTAQEIQWNNAPQKGFVYEISNKEAQKLLASPKSVGITGKLLHTLVDSFDVKKGWINRPAKGHFILVKIIANKLHCEYTCVFPYQVFLLKEYNALALQVLDLNGNVRDDAKVKLALRRLSIDRESKTYRIENDWFRTDNQTTSVELEGFRSFFTVHKHDVPSWHQDYNNDEGPAFYSYLITDKNKYKPNEHVRFKSYALSHIKTPIRKDLEIWLNAYPKNIKLGSIAPHRPGSFAGEFHLHDSLKLVLDRSYSLQLRDKTGRIVASCQFTYEDYELFGNKLELQLEKSKHYYPESNKLTITATDVNGLILKDAKASVLVKTATILESFQPLIILPDTLLFTHINLDPAKPTTINIPPEIFQKANTSYNVLVTVLNSENQRTESAQAATFYYSSYELNTRFSNDSICFELLKNNVPLDYIPITLRLNGELTGRQVILPHKEKLNPAITGFHLQNELLTKDIVLSLLKPDIELVGGIQKDSFNISLRNAQKLEISWFIYQGSLLIKKGFGTELDFKSLIEDRTHTYYVELLYSFGGKEHARRSQYEFREDFLNVTLDIPERIYPGQQVDAVISVTDQLGEPVRNVDLTALAVTSKLNYRLPDLPYFGSSSSPRPMRANYSKSDLNRYSAVLDLDYGKWLSLARLDTMIYYHFTYPRSTAFMHTVDIEDNTQFAPFVMKRGQAEQIHVIEVDHVPVYFSWTKQPKGYSFYVSPVGKHEISLRLHDRVLILDSIAFEKGKKTIISIDLDHLPDNVDVKILGTALTQTELNRYTRYISEFMGISYKYGYLESTLEFVPLFSMNNQQNRYGNIVAGPVSPGRTNYVEGEHFQIAYTHDGGYRYDFEDNIVYKLNSDNLLPKYLNSVGFDPLVLINDAVITKKYFLESQYKDAPYNKWQARTIDVVDSDSRIRIFLPVDSVASGIAAVVFENCTTKNTTSPYFDNYYRHQSNFYSLPIGCNSIIVLYNNGTYLKMDSVFLKQNIHVVADLNTATWYPADSLSWVWLSNYAWRPSRDYVNPPDRPSQTRTGQFIFQNSTGNLSGAVFDENNDPLPGVNILIKGTQYGTVTDVEGRFTLLLDDYIATLVFSYVGFVSQEIEVTRGSEVIVQLEPDIQSLEEVVVIGYGISRKSELTGSVSTISGQDFRIPDEEADSQDNKQEEEIIHEAEQRLYRELLTLNSIRSSFSDVGFWEPRLYTDKQGESGFSINFPDDITQWDAVVYGMNKYLQTGTARETIKSYKPLMAELHVPQFLTRGDSAQFLGKVLNYTADSLIQGQVRWTGAGSDFTREIGFTQFHSDMLPVNVISTDSITTRYSFTRNDGYLDGEERTVPIVEQGIIRAEGSLSVLKNGDERNVKASANETVIVEVSDNQLGIYGEEVKYLLNYRYACNEQLASKLIGLLNHKLLMQFEGKPFNYDRDVNKIIRRLLKNQNKEFLWSWWDISVNTSYWMSSHILRALKYAKDAGYEVELSIENITSKAEYQFNMLKSFSLSDIDLVHALAVWGVDLNYNKYIRKLDSIVTDMDNKLIYGSENRYYSYSNLKEKFLLQEIRQMKGLEFQPDTLMKYKKEGILGEVFFSDDKPSRYWYTDDLSANVIAYRILKHDSVLKQLQVPMQLYFIGTRKNGSWNTYQSSNLLMNVLPDLLAAGYTKGNTATLQVSGKENKTITKFPYRMALNPTEELKIHKESGLPLYYMQYVNERVTAAKTGIEGFRIKTYFSNNNRVLEAGKTVELIVDVDVEKSVSVEHVMIEVPIPGACSYADKRQEYYGVETHREYFKDRTLIFCENMAAGKHTFVIRLLPRFTGSYLVNPAQVSLMYIPVVNANTDMKRVEVR